MESTSQLNLDEIDGELQVIKCVVVGDTGVGKTRLICARALGTTYTLQQLVQTHVPTVWAIDQYRKNPQALQKSWCTVDNVNVSLRLWDTFGDHSKDRRFAYGRADVILVCFSAVQPRSLQHVWNHWHSEMQRLCPRVPIVLCGCQVDMRYVYKESSFLDIDKGPFFKEIYDDDILLPEAGRTVARQIGAYYYETSVLEQFGIDFLFTNVVRAALVYKRDSHFWNNFGLLKGISRPLCQPPHLPPKRLHPEVVIPEPQWTDDVNLELLRSKTFSDVVFLVQRVPIAAHRACLIASSSAFDALFSPSFHDSSLHHRHGDVANDKIDSSPISWNKDDGFGETNVALSVETLNDSALSNDRSGLQKSRYSVGEIFTLIESPVELKASGFRGPTGTVVVLVNDSISPTSFRSFLEFQYTGKLTASGDILREVRRIGQSIGLATVVNYVENVCNDEEYLNRELISEFHSERNKKLVNTVIPNCLFSDVEFKLDDGRVKAHRAMLSARCDVMANMFSSNFMEASAKVISYPGITTATFRVLQTFLYTGEYCDLPNVNRMELIELANRLCLPQLLAYAEQSTVRELTIAEKSWDIAEEVLTYLEPAQLHNAAQLASWCLWYLSVNYLDVYRRYCKHLHSLRPDNQIYLTSNRHPPLWYLKEFDIYERFILDMQREKTVRRPYSQRQSKEVDTCGCLCFGSRRN